MKRKSFLLFSLICLLLAGCQNGQDTPSSREDTKPQEESREENQEDNEEVAQEKIQEEAGEETKVEIQVEAGEEKGEEFHRAALLADQIYKENKENTIVSPISLDLALCLVAQGACEETAQELFDYLGGSNYESNAKEYLAYAQSLTSEKNEEFLESQYSFQYTLANAVWVNEKCTLKEEYGKEMLEKYQAEVAAVDFVNKKEDTVKRINAWCNERTNGLIPSIIDSSMLSEELTAILMNSVYFESPWENPWNSKEHPFTNLYGTTDVREMLFDTVTTYYENEKAWAFSKNYYNGFQFIGILPKTEGEFQISDLDLDSLLASATNEYDVRACMPKLDYETATKPKTVIEILKEQGVNRVFDQNLSQMDRMVELKPNEKLYISEILQKCKIELDENGTRAAAVTSVFVSKNSAFQEKPREVKEVYLDRPFAFLIYDSMQEKIVFIGKVVE